MVWSAVTACAIERDATVGETVAAAALGYELTRAARGGPRRRLVERTGTRFVHRAHAASSGVACARAAQAGLPASRVGLESGRGAFAPSDPDAFTAGLLALREMTAVEETGFRLYAATGFAHSAIDAALSIGRTEPADVARVTGIVAPAAATALASDPHGRGRRGGVVEHRARRGGLPRRGRPGGARRRPEHARRRARPLAAGRDTGGRRGLGGGRLTGRNGAPSLERLLAAGDTDPFAAVLDEALAPFPAAVAQLP